MENNKFLFEFFFFFFFFEYIINIWNIIVIIYLLYYNICKYGWIMLIRINYFIGGLIYLFDLYMVHHILEYIILFYTFKVLYINNLNGSFFILIFFMYLK